MALDKSQEKRVRLNFNITMMDLKCEYTVVDVVSVLGTEQNVSSHISKWHVDGAGVRRMFQGRNKEQHDISLFDENVDETLDELLEDGEEAVSLDEETFNFARHEKQFLFVDFYASCKCVHFDKSHVFFSLVRQFCVCFLCVLLFLCIYYMRNDFLFVRQLLSVYVFCKWEAKKKIKLTECLSSPWAFFLVLLDLLYFMA